ncbi:MAG: hypothetical protein EHM23_31260 [Acidobacteria bacterium]|nr:MAG: hypothetical protein EHM23_31260 [Acidobacteriota bacterium]
MRLRTWLIAVLIVLSPCSLWGVIGTIDVTPAATLLFPYFEVELAEPNAMGRTTIITIQAATPTATVAHVTLWTDLGIPTYAFDVYLTGYDMQAISVRDIFEGNLPRTASDGQDPPDTISNQGLYSQDINFPSCTGRLPYQPIPADILADIRAAHTGNAIPSSGRFAGTSRGDQVARGYITVDTTTQCSALLPNQAGYFTSVASNLNSLLGEYVFIDPAENFMYAEKAVHIEASSALAGQRTFYGRLASAAGGIDIREPLPSTWVFGALTDPVVAGRTELILWRDPGVEVSTFTSQPPAGPFPMPVVEARAYDDESRPSALAPSFAPYAAGKIRVMETITSKLGWGRLNLNVGPAAADGRQSWVTPIRTWEGRFSTGANGVQLDPGTATIGALDNVPAATLLLPYFQVDITGNQFGKVMFTVHNVSAEPRIAHVTLWTDVGMPTLSFDIYLAGQDLVDVDMRAVFAGIVPHTSRTLSNIGADASPAIAFPGCDGMLPAVRLTEQQVQNLRQAHQGQASGIFGGNCGASAFGDGQARGYVTIDVVNRCSTSFPGDAGYFVSGGTGIASNANVLWGEFRIVDQPDNMAYAELLVPIEASNTLTSGYTFYGRRVNGDASDNRERLPSLWEARYIAAGVFQASIQVWRDSMAPAPWPCGNPRPAISHRRLFIFDEQENASTLSDGTTSMIPLATSLLPVHSIAGIPIPSWFDFGFIFLDLRLGTTAVDPLFGGMNQSHVSIVHRASGRFGGLTTGWPVDSTASEHVF